MPTLITEPFHILRDLLATLIGFLTGRRRLTLRQTLLIRAPRELVWRYIRADDLQFDGWMAMRIVIERNADRPNMEIAHITIGDRSMPMVLRVAEEREQEAILMELIAEGTDPAIVTGVDDYLAYVLRDAPDGTLLTISREVSPTSYLAPLMVPMSFRNGARMIKRTFERLAKEERSNSNAARPSGSTTAGVEDLRASAAPGQSAAAAPSATAPVRSSWGLTPNGIVFSLIALASFAYLWGWQEALLLTAIIILHELGHAAAMLMVGMPVKGIYLVPFFGGAAIAAGPYRSEGQLGFVALMGPGFSLVSTAALVLAARYDDNPLFKQAAEMSAIVNLMNLAPIIPLDGGHVLRAALVSMSRTLAQIAGFAGAALGLWLAWLANDIIIWIFVGLGVLITFQIRKDTSRQPMRVLAAFSLIAAFVATSASYIALIAILNNKLF